MTQTGQAVWRWGLVAACIVFWASTWSRDGYAQNLPEVLAHSKLGFAVYKGDRLKLEIKAKGEALEAKWLDSAKTVCRQLSCEFDTKDWGLGTQRLTVIVFNASGSLALRYRIRVMAPPAGFRPGVVEPPLVTAEASIENVADEDLTVRMLSGRGFSYHRRKLQVVGPKRRALDWQERLKTQQTSAMQVGRIGHEAHIVAGASTVSLLRADSGRRALLLRHGAVRSRQLNGEDPRWSVLVPDWLQVDTDAAGDILVERLKGEPERVAITVLRGKARVFIHADTGKKASRANSQDTASRDESESEDSQVDDESEGDDEDDDEAENDEAEDDEAEDDETEDASYDTYEDYDEGRTKANEVHGSGKAVVVAAGSELILTRGVAQLPPPSWPDAKRLEHRVKETTPFYLPGLSAAEQAADATLLGANRPKKFKAAVALARVRLHQRDAFAAIEALQPFDAAVRKSYSASMALGEAYLMVGLYSAASIYLEIANNLKPQAARPHFLSGLSHLAGQRWAQAAKAFEAADDRDFEDPQVLNYYLAIAMHNAGNPVRARSHFESSLWTPNHEQIAASARQFLQQSEDDRWFEIRLAGGVIYDSNVLRLAESVRGTLPGELESDKGFGYAGNAYVGLWPLRGRGGALGFTFAADKTGWFESSMDDVALLRQILAIESRLNFGTEDETGPTPAVLAIDLTLFAATNGVGDQRTDDSIGGRFLLHSPALWGLGAGVASTISVDPLPGEDDLYDPRLELAVGPTDRSARRLDYLLTLRPIDDHEWLLALNARSGKTTYTFIGTQDDDHKELALGLGAAYIASLRNRFDLNIEQMVRTWTEADDGRKDTRRGIDLGWRFGYTTSLSQRLSVGYESMDSSRSDVGYKRQLAGLSLMLEL